MTDVGRTDNRTSSSASGAIDRGEAILERLVDRARRVLQQHVRFGHVPAIFHDDGCYPHYAQSAEGARFVDVTGRAYVDWFLGGGPVLLGHNHPSIRRAIAEQLELGPHLSLPTPLEVDVAERIVEQIPTAEQVVIGKNGTDVTGAAIRLARAITGREQVISCGYHGFQDWSIATEPQAPGIPAAMRKLVTKIDHGDLERARDLMLERGRDVAALIVEPICYAEPSRDFLVGLRELANEFGALLIFDEIVTGFRVARGGAQEWFDVHPDLTCLGKALANGTPLAALVGPHRWMRHMPFTRFGMTYRRDALSLAAARAALDLYAKQNVPKHISSIGQVLIDGVNRTAEGLGLSWRLRGHPAMPHFEWSGDGRLTEDGAMLLFIERCQRAGIYVAPRRVFLSAAHTVDDAKQTLSVFEQALEAVREAAESGLDAVLDSPLAGGLQRRASTNRNRTWGGGSVDSPFEEMHPNLRSKPLRTSWAPDDDTTSIEATDRALRFAIEHVDPAQEATLELKTHTFSANFQAAATYRIENWSPRNATVSCSLSFEGEQQRFGGRHDMNIGRHCYARAFLNDRRMEVPCAYGPRRATLRIENRGGTVRIWQTLDEDEELLTSFEGVTTVTGLLAFRVFVRGASGPVSIVLDRFEAIAI